MFIFVFNHKEEEGKRSLLTFLLATRMAPYMYPSNYSEKSDPSRTMFFSSRYLASLKSSPSAWIFLKVSIRVLAS